jgi:DNA-binding response OmpR family regulator
MRVLIAGRERFECDMLERFFRRSGYETVAVGGGEAAVRELVAPRRTDVVLALDRLDDGSAITLVRWIHRRAGSDLRVLVLTSAEEDWAVRAYDAGADMVVRKPVDLRLLERMVIALVRRAWAGDDGGAQGNANRVG